MLLCFFKLFPMVGKGLTCRMVDTQFLVIADLVLLVYLLSEDTDL